MAARRYVDVLSWALRIGAALILFRSAYFDFTGSATSVHIFETVGQAMGAAGLMEPYGRFAIGVIELLAAVLLLMPISTLPGAVLAVLVASGAIFSHLFTDLGIVVVVGGISDGGLTFGLAVLVALASLGEIAISMFSRD